MEGREARQQLVQQVKDDITQVLSHSWEMREVLKTAPKANPATLQRLSRPKHAVVRHPGDSCMYAGWKSLQLSKQRAVREQQEREEAQYEAARQEALQGWLRAHEQEQRQAALLYQQQLEEQEKQARVSASRVTRLAISDLDTLKQQLEQQKHQAAAAGQHLAHRCGTRAALRHRWPAMWDPSGSDAGGDGKQPPAHQHVQPVVSYINNYLHR